MYTGKPYESMIPKDLLVCDNNDERSIIRRNLEIAEIKTGVVVDCGEHIERWLNAFREYCYVEQIYVGVDVLGDKVFLRWLGDHTNRSGPHAAWIRARMAKDGAKKSRMHIYLPNVLFDRIDKRIKDYGYRSRNEWLQQVAELALERESIRQEWEEMCLDCSLAEKDPRCTHCNKPGHVFKREPDKYWNESCKPGQERTIDFHCSCEDCGEPVPGVDTPSEAE